jgi:hypothetical protein
MTKAAASRSRSRISRNSGMMTPSASPWLSIPGGPSGKVSAVIGGPPGRRSGSTAASMARVTASVELGLMTRIACGIAFSPSRRGF